MNLRDIREYYGKSTGLLSFMNLIFVMVISGIGIYIADIMSEDAENETKVFCLYTVFIVGTILAILLIISCFMGRKGDYEAAFRFRKLLSAVGFVIGALSLIVSGTAIVETYKEWSDSYTASIFIIQLAGSIFTVAANILMFVLAVKGGRYYDSKSLAKDIPENMTTEKNNKKYMFIINLSYIVMSVSVFLLSLYFANEIDNFSIQDLTDNSKYSEIYRIIFKAGIVTSALVFISGIMVLILKNKKVYSAGRVSYLVNTVAQLAFVIYSLINIPKDFVKAQCPDITYIVFGIILTAVSVVLAMKSDSIARNS